MNTRQAIAAIVLGNDEISATETHRLMELANSCAGGAGVAAALRKRVAEFKRAGGRGVGLADEIDALKVSTAVHKAEKARAHKLARRLETIRKDYMDYIHDLFAACTADRDGKDDEPFAFDPFIGSCDNKAIDVHAITLSAKDDEELVLVAYEPDDEGAQVDPNVPLADVDLDTLRVLVERLCA